jgi:large conductance mechanosensitive channel
MLKEFKAFIMRGNVVDLAVAVILGAAFGAIINSLVTDIITPALLNPALKAAHVDNIAELKAFGTVVVKDGKEIVEGGILYGAFLAKVINFLVIAFCLFMVIKLMNKAANFRKKQEAEVPAAPAEPSNEEKLLTEIRDLLKTKQ